MFNIRVARGKLAVKTFMAASNRAIPIPTKGIVAAMTGKGKPIDKTVNEITMIVEPKNNVLS
jgi:hypothetical protein